MLRFVMLCYVMLCYVMLCYVRSCYVLLCYVMVYLCKLKRTSRPPPDHHQTTRPPEVCVPKSGFQTTRPPLHCIIIRKLDHQTTRPPLPTAEIACSPQSGEHSKNPYCAFGHNFWGINLTGGAPPPDPPNTEKQLGCTVARRPGRPGSTSGFDLRVRPQVSTSRAI